MEEIYLAGGCLWGVQAFIKTIPGVHKTEAGRANGNSDSLENQYDGYSECVKITFDCQTYSINKQGEDIGEKYRTGVYSKNKKHLEAAQHFIDIRDDADQIAVEVCLLTNYLRSAEEHQDRLDKFPNDYCHIPDMLLKKYRKV